MTPLCTSEPTPYLIFYSHILTTSTLLMSSHTTHTAKPHALSTISDNSYSSPTCAQTFWSRGASSRLSHGTLPTSIIDTPHRLRRLPLINAYSTLLETLHSAHRPSFLPSPQPVHAELPTAPNSFLPHILAPLIRSHFLTLYVTYLAYRPNSSLLFFTSLLTTVSSSFLPTDNTVRTYFTHLHLLNVFTAPKALQSHIFNMLSFVVPVIYDPLLSLLSARSQNIGASFSRALMHLFSRDYLVFLPITYIPFTTFSFLTHTHPLLSRSLSLFTHAFT